ncbi:MAG: hypothetical protein ACOX8U_10875 [Bradymonadia bacterium]|jgi:hypothetical protein
MSELGTGGINEQGDGDLVGQRNENSVLFSLDSLARADESDGQGAGAGFSFGSGGDQSGLIDLNTLAKLGAGGGDDSNMEVPVVFNDVGYRRRSKGLIIGMVIISLLLVGGGIAGYFVYQNMKAEQAARDEQARLEAERLAQVERDKKELEAKLEQARLEAEAESKRREADAEAVRLALAKQAEEEAAQAADSGGGSAGSGSRKTGSKTPSKTSTTTATAPAPSKGSGPKPADVRNALLASADKAKKCAKGGTLDVSFTLNGDGKATNVTATGGSFKGTATERCIITVVQRHDFPRFSGSPVKGVKFTYKM